MRDRIAILAGVRTPFCKSGGVLKHVPADDLGAVVVSELLARTGIDGDAIDEIIFGNVAQPPGSANIARVIGLKAGLPRDLTAQTVHRNCASGMQSLSTAALQIMTSRSNLVLVGGTESMSQIPLLVSAKMTALFIRLMKAKTAGQRVKALATFRPAHLKPIIGLQLGLTDPVCGMNMGQTAEVLAREFGVTREDQDSFALASHRKAAAARREGRLAEEIAPIVAPPDYAHVQEHDDGPREEQSAEALAKLRPYFDRHAGTVTVGNACPVTDGAVAMLVASESHAKKMGVEPLGYLTHWSYAALDGSRMGLGPVYATAKILEQSKMTMKDIDLVELNEAFAAQVVANERAFGSKSFAQNHLERSQAVGEIDPERPERERRGDRAGASGGRDRRAPGSDDPSRTPSPLAGARAGHAVRGRRSGGVHAPGGRVNMKKNAWTIEIDHEWIAWLTFDLPGETVNKFTREALDELDRALDELAENEAIKAVALRSGKRDSFIVGADIDELARMENEEQAREIAQRGQMIFDKIAGLPVPSVAVIHGAAMGGGLEIALACTYRLATDHAKTTLGLPEVNLGILPGWGGTQRLPRLIGLAPAMGMVLTGKPASHRKALRAGLVDGIVAPEFAESQTRAFINDALKTSGRKRIEKRRRARQSKVLRLMSATPPARSIMYRKARKGILSKTNGHYPAPLAALRVIRSTYRKKTLQAGLEIEANALAELAASSESRNLVWLFQASQRTKGGSGSKRTSRNDVDCAGVVGGGIMGAGIAWALSNAGIRVRLHDVNWPAAARGMKSIARMYGELTKRRKMTRGEMTLAMHRVGPTIDYTGFADADIVIEAVVEDLKIKHQVLRDIEARVSPDAIIATNTSSLPLPELAGALKRPQRFVGLHFFNPVNRMKLVEVVACRKTSRKTLESAAALVRRMGKTPIIVGDCPGFLVNRILLPYLIESTWMFEEGVDAERLDRALERFGMPMGPLALVDEVGIDVGYKVAKVLEGSYGERMNVAPSLGRIAETGEFLGKKSGRGIYVYDNGHKKVNGAIEPLLRECRNGHGVREIDDEEIVDRAVLIMINEAARCLEEGIAQDAESIDLAMVFGTGFAPFRGGLLHYADARGVREIRDALHRLAQKYGERFRPAPLVEELSRSGGRFHGNGVKRRRVRDAAA